MQGQRSCELRRSVGKVLAALLGVLVTSLVPATALADRTESAPAQDDAPAQAPPAKHVKRAKRAVEGAPGKGKKGKRTAHRAEPEARRAAHRPCVGTSITIDRGGLEGQSMEVLDCHGRPRESAQVALSVLARPWGAQKPAHLGIWSARSERTSKGKTGTRAVVHDGSDLAPGVRLLDRGLLVRLGAVAHRFPGRPISLVSGFRPQSRGSMHQRARALDLRVAGVSNEELVAFCKTLADTGCGYYPHSSFIHMDVRGKGVGVVTWIDTSGPGESPHYVSQWPPPPEQSDTAVLPPDDEPHGIGTDAPGDALDPARPERVDEHTVFPAARGAEPIPPALPPRTTPLLTPAAPAPAASAHGAGLTVSPAPAARP